METYLGFQIPYSFGSYNRENKDGEFHLSVYFTYTNKLAVSPKYMNSKLNSYCINCCPKADPELCERMQYTQATEEHISSTGWLGLGIMAIGVWAWTEKDTFNNLSRLTNVALDPAFILILVETFKIFCSARSEDYLIKPTSQFISDKRHVVSSINFIRTVTFIIGFTGCVGALRENTCLLATFALKSKYKSTHNPAVLQTGKYAIFLALLLLMEMAAGVLGFVFKDWIKSQATGGFQAFIIHYREDPDQQNLIDWIQEDWEEKKKQKNDPIIIIRACDVAVNHMQSRMHYQLRKKTRDALLIKIMVEITLIDLAVLNIENNGNSVDD
ncbi:Tetraspanin-5 [Melipona quadrifasciata]|uniref:Tetraspanin-5 n=1 Tax=Melipona quadrifasciata TaxID=166423 RepID=A0A0N0BI98_9HYME|nr:Tetraspanin-5 [Melipona quadrifasciata]